MKKHSTYHRTLLALAASALMATACTHAQTDILPALPPDEQHATSAGIPLGESWLHLEYYRSGDSCRLNVEADKKLLPTGHQLELQLCGTPYSTASGKEWFAPIATITKPGTYRFKLSEQDFRKNGGPYDYNVRLTLSHNNGKKIDSRDCRLTEHIPAPGADIYYEQENRDSLLKLQAAAERCASMRLVMIYHMDCIKDVPLPLSGTDTKELCRLIGRMRPVKSHLHEVIPILNMELTLLDSQGKELCTMDPFDITAEKHVSPENAADMASYALSNEDAATWYSIIYSPSVKQTIKQAVEENKKQRSKRR